MNQRPRFGAVLTTLALLVLAGEPGAQAPANADAIFAKVEPAIQAEMAKLGAPGAGVAVAVGDRIVWAKGFGLANIETKAPVTPDTLFQIGSSTKSFTAAAILAASAGGAIAMDKPVSTYISGLTACVGAPTLTQLLSHTGGIMDEPDEYGPQGEEGLGAYQRTWSSEYCLLPPGRAFSYSNSGYSLAGLALQEVDKKPYAEVMRERVLTPLGMTRTTFRPTEAMTWPLAVGHRIGRDGKPTTVVRPLANDARLWPAGTLYSTPNEMARFAIALMNDGRIDGKQALPSGVAVKMRTPVADMAATGERYGLGMYVRPQDVSHAGTMTGYVAHYGLEANQKLAIVVLTNGDVGNPEPIVNAVRPAAYAAAGLPMPAAASPPATTGATPLSADEARGYVGTYRNPRRFTVEVVQQGASLVLRRFGRDFPMTYVSPGRFTVDLPRGGTETIPFGLGANGRAEYLQMNVWALARVDK